jgi:hypothetical protein
LQISGRHGISHTQAHCREERSGAAREGRDECRRERKRRQRKTGRGEVRLPILYRKSFNLKTIFKAILATVERKSDYSL